MTATQQDETQTRYITRGGVAVTRGRRPASYEKALDAWVDRLDARRGAVFSSSYEYPGRYSRWDMAIADPPLAISCIGRDAWIDAFNERGEALLSIIVERLAGETDMVLGQRSERRLDIAIERPERPLMEEERSRAPTVFSLPESHRRSLPFAGRRFDWAFRRFRLRSRLPVRRHRPEAAPARRSARYGAVSA